MWKSAIPVSFGAALGALLRCLLGIRLNCLFPAIPPGTLTANRIGGYLIGFGTEFFASFSSLAPERRLLAITGYCAALTTFSTFSADVGPLH